MEIRSSGSHKATRKPRACIPCHERKVRCDSSAVGVPCSRCISKNRTDYCALLGNNKRKNKKRNHDAGDSGCSRPESGVEASNQGQRDASDALCGNYGALRSKPTTPQSLFDSAQITELPSFPNGIGLYRGQDEQPTMTGYSAGETIPAMSQCQVRERELSGPASEDCAVTEEDAQVQTLRQMSRGKDNVPTPTTLSASSQGQRVIEYYGRLNSITILGEVLGQQQQKRLIQIVVPGPESATAKQRELSGLDSVDIRYLNEKGVHNFPARSVCDKLLRLFFECIYPYVPILDRVEFIEDYECGNISSFLLQSIFTNVVPYTPSELLVEAGYPDRLSAQKDFASKAKVLFDLGCEKGQLRMLQGSLLLSSFQSSVAPNKDFRFWLHNAIRIATQMGLHRENLSEDLDPATHKLCRRIWWVLYQRDVLLSVSGFENSRQIYDSESDTAIPREDDWEEQRLTLAAEKILPPFTRLHKLYFVENCKLSVIGARFLCLFRSPGPPAPVAAAHELAEAIIHWRSMLPVELLIDRVVHWSNENVWILVLLAMSYRLECIFYRELKAQMPSMDDEASIWAGQRLYNSIFELDTVIRRVVTHNLDQCCPASMIVCASTVLALQVEVALDPAADEPQRLIAKAHIHAGVSYLRAIGENWLSAKWTLRLFETIVSRPDLSLTPESVEKSNTAIRQDGDNHCLPPNENESLHEPEQPLQPVTIRPQERFEELPNNWMQDLSVLDLLDASFMESVNDHFLDLRPLM